MGDKMQQDIIPLGLGLHITHRCNLRCRMCWYWGEQGRQPNDKELSTEQIKNLLSAVKVKFISIGGGEPLMRDDLLDILEYAHNEGIKCEVLTNGTLITPELAEGLIKWASSVVISLEGPREINDAIRGEGSFDKAIEGLKLLNMPTRINTTISCLNYEYLDRMPEIASELHCYLSLQHLVFGEGDSFHKLDTNKLIRKLNATWGRAFELGVPYHLTPPLRGDREIELWYSGLSPIPKMYCPFLWTWLFIEPDGRVTSCEFISEVFGDVINDSIEELWNGDKAREFRKSLMNNLTCMRCCKLEPLN